MNNEQTKITPEQAKAHYEQEVKEIEWRYLDAIGDADRSRLTELRRAYNDYRDALTSFGSSASDAAIGVSE